MDYLNKLRLIAVFIFLCISFSSELRSQNDALFSVESNAHGIMIPSMSEDHRKAIQNPSVGLLVFQNTEPTGFCYYNGTEWVILRDAKMVDAEKKPFSDMLTDSDKDTKVQVEKSSDEDVIRFDLAGTERWKLSGKSLSPSNSGSSLFIGEMAGFNDDLSSNKNTFIGNQSGTSNTNGYFNTSLGFNSLSSNTSGYQNTALGYGGLQNAISAFNNTAIGFQSLLSNIYGSYNTAIGFRSLVNNETGNYNTAIGSEALLNNTGGMFNTAIGVKADVLMGNLINATAIGYNAKVESSNSLILGGTGNYAVNVGIGLTNPDAELHVIGNIKMVDGNQGIGKILTSDGDGFATWQELPMSSPTDEIQDLNSVLTEGNDAAGLLIRNLQDPENAQDAATKNYVDANDDVDDADNDPTNELDNTDNQSLTIAGHTLQLSSDDGTDEIDLSNYLDNTDSQDLSLNGNTLSLTNDGSTVDLSKYYDNTDSQNIKEVLSEGNDAFGQNIENLADPVNAQDAATKAYVDLNDDVNDADADATNEIQTLDVSQLSGTNLELSLSSDGQATKIIDLSTLQDGTGTDDQALTLSGNSLSIEDGNSVDLSAYLDNTDSQNLSLSGTNLTIANGNSVDLSSLQDGTGTDDQDLKLNGNTLSLTNDPSTVNLSKYLDNTDNQTLKDVLEESNNAAGQKIKNLADPENPHDAATKSYVDNNDDVDDADADATNEIQTLDVSQLSGTNLELSLSSDGQATKVIDLSSLRDGTGTDDQDLNLSGNILAIEGGNSVDLSAYLDNTDSQNLSISGTNLTIEYGNTVDLSSIQDGVGTDAQDLSLSGNTLSLTNDASSVDLSSYLDNTDTQDLSIDSSGNVFTINLTDGGLVKFEDSVDDADADASNEIQTLDVSQLSGTNLELSLSSDSQATKVIDLSSLQDGTGTDSQELSLTGTTLSIEDGNTVDLSVLQDGVGTDNQDLSLSGNTLSLSNDGTTVDLSSYLDNTDTQDLSIDSSGNVFTINLTDGGLVKFEDSVDDADADATNEIQTLDVSQLSGTNLELSLSSDGQATKVIDLSSLQDGTGTDDQDLSLSGNTLSLSNDGTTVDLSAYLDNTDSQDLSLSGNTLSLTNDASSVDLSSYLDNTDTQDLSIDSSGNVFTINLTDGGLVKFEDSVDDADADATNEIQTLDVSQLSGTNLELSLSSDGQATKSIDLSSLQDGTGTDDQSLTLSSNTLSIEDGNSVDLSSYLDNTDAQDLSLSGNTLSLTNDGTTVDLSAYLDNTDSQDLSLSGNTLSLTNDASSVDLSSYLDNTDTQDLSIDSSGNVFTINLTDGGLVKFEDSVDDADADASNEIQTLDVSQLSGTNLELSLSSDGQATKVIDLSSLQDGTGTDDQSLTLSGNSLSIEDGNSVDLSAYLDNTDTQDLSIDSSGNVFTINLTDGGLVKFEDSVDDADADATNEIQTLDVSQLSGTNLELSLSSDGQASKIIDLSSLQDGTGTDDQSLTLSSNTLSIEDGNSVDLSAYLDNTDNQDLSLSGNTLSLTNDGTTVDLSSYLDNTDAQDLSLSGNTLSLTNDGTSVDLSAYLDNTDTQDLSIDSSGNVFTINLTDGGLVKFEDSVDDADADATNEIQTLDVSQLSGTNLELSLSSDGQATKVIDLSSLQDGTGTDDQSLTLSSNTLSIEDGNSVDLSSYLDNTDAQDLSLSGNTLSLTNDGTTVDLSAYLDNTDTQDLSIDSSGNVFTINLTDGGLIKFEDSVDDADADATNEIQTLDVSQLSGTNLELSLSSDGQATKVIDLSSLQDGTGTDDQSLTLSNNTLSIEDGNSVDLSAYLDNTDNQDLSLSGNTLSLTNDGTTVDLSAYMDNTDSQDLSLSGNSLSLSNDASSVDLSGYLDNTDAQDLSLSGITLSLSNDASSVDLSGYLDNTDAQDLSLSGNTLSLTNDGTSVDLSGYLDNTDNQDLSLSGNTLSLTNDGTTVDLSGYLDNTDDQTLSEVLTEGNDAGASKISNLADPTLAQDAATKAYVDANDHWEDSTDDIYNSNAGNVGIGTSSPSSKLHVNGSITIGSDSNPSPVEGTIRWNSTSKNFEGFNGTIWINISTGEQSITNEQDKDFASDQNTDDLFGYSVSISGDYAIIGAYRNDDAGGDSGSAYIFVRSGNNWTEQAKLTASDAAGGDKFGISVGISGDYAIVGSREDDDDGDKSGSAYIFFRSGTSWSQQAKLTASDAAAGDKFGTAVAIDGDYAIAGAPENDDGGDKTGSAYVFLRSGTSWSQQAKLNASDAGAGDRLGFAVSISGEYAIAGAYQDDDDGDKSGSAYIFFRSGTSWSQQAKLTASDADVDDEFGLSVSISGDYAVVGAHQDDDAGLDSGSAYVFNRSGTSWSQQAKLTSNEAAAGDLYGRAVSISGDYIIVGAYAASGSGVSYIYSRSGTSWLETSKLVASDAANGDLFGFAVAIDGAYTIVGAYADDNDGSCNFFNAY